MGNSAVANHIKITPLTKGIKNASKNNNNASKAIEDFPTKILSSAPKINRDTLRLLEENENDFTILIKKLITSNTTVKGMIDLELNRVKKGFLDLCDVLLSGIVDEDKTMSEKSQEQFYIIINIVSKSQFGDGCMIELKNKIRTVQENYPKDSKFNEDPTLLPKLTSIVNHFKVSVTDESQKKDKEYLTRFGKKAIPTEIEVINQCLKHYKSLFQSIQTDFNEFLKKFILHNPKYELKKMEKALLDLNYIKRKIEELKWHNEKCYDFIYDLIKVEVSFANAQDLIKCYESFCSQFKVAFTFQNEKDSKTKKMIVEHKQILLEVVFNIQGREHSVLEKVENLRYILFAENNVDAYEIVRSWGEYKIFLEPYHDLCGCLEPPTFSYPNQYICKTINEKPEISTMYKSLEYGIEDLTEECTYIEDNLGNMLSREFNYLYSEWNQLHINGVSLHGISRTIARGFIEIISSDNLVKNIIGTYDPVNGISCLTFITIQDERIKVGDENRRADEVTFDMAIPDHCVVFGLGGKNSPSGMSSVYCWFGPIPSHFKYFAGCQNERLTHLSLLLTNGLFKCHLCQHELIWVWRSTNSKCENCDFEIPQGSGLAICRYDGFTCCSKCLTSINKKYQKLDNVTSKICPNKHKGKAPTLEWKNSEEFECQKCKKNYPENIGSFSCTSCKLSLCSGCYSKDDEIVYDILMEEYNSRTFPIITTKLDCRNCKSCPLKWYWHACLIGPQYIYSVKCQGKNCKRSAPASAGTYYCEECSHTYCSSCYIEKAGTDLTEVENHLDKSCPNKKNLIWSYSFSGVWDCNICKLSFPERYGGYCCSNEDLISKEHKCDAYKECAGCYLRSSLSFDYELYYLPHNVDFIPCNKCNTPMRWEWKSESKFTCNKCDSSISPSAGCFTCQQCKSSHCTKCYYDNSGGNAMVIKNVIRYCDDHELLLEWQYKFTGERWSCGRCLRRFYEVGGFSCGMEGCDFRICCGCYREELIESGSSTLKLKKIL